MERNDGELSLVETQYEKDISDTRCLKKNSEFPQGCFYTIAQRNQPSWKLVLEKLKQLWLCTLSFSWRCRDMSHSFTLTF